MIARVVIAFLMAVAATACTAEKPAVPPATQQTAAAPVPGTSAAEAPLPEVASPYDALPEDVRPKLLNPFTGDLDEMIKRRVIRVAVTFKPNPLLHRQGPAARAGV